MIVAACVAVFSGFLPVQKACAQELVRIIPFFGDGPYEILMFSDYFCPHCRLIDEKAEPLLKELVAAGKTKITFIDVPFTRITPMYAKYYLQAVNAQPDIDNALRVRKALFEAAMEKDIRNEERLTAHLTIKEIQWAQMNEKSIFPLMGALIKEHKINQTPTCLIKYPAGELKRFTGRIEIWNGLNELKNHLSQSKN